MSLCLVTHVAFGSKPVAGLGKVGLNILKFFSCNRKNENLVRGNLCLPVAPTPEEIYIHVVSTSYLNNPSRCNRLQNIHESLISS